MQSSEVHYTSPPGLPITLNPSIYLHIFVQLSNHIRINDIYLNWSKLLDDKLANLINNGNVLR